MFSATATNNRFVLTGGPGAGKTTLLRELERRGYRCVPEVARQIIREQVEMGGDAVPWGNTARYAELMLAGSIEAYLLQGRMPHASGASPTFFDRGIPDTLCYARLIALPDTRAIEVACATYRYNPRVFIAPPWEEIYATDGGAQSKLCRGHRDAQDHGRNVCGLRLSCG
jgi:predicted ATPase